MVYPLQERIVAEIQIVKDALGTFALKLTGNSADASDLYQETLIRIIFMAHKFKSGSNFKAWAMIIMKNLFINNYRKKSRRKVLLESNSSAYYFTTSLGSRENEGTSALHLQDLMKMVDTLSDAIKIPFMMKFEGYKYTEIAEEMDLPVGTIKSRIFIARKKLRILHDRLNQ